MHRHGFYVILVAAAAAFACAEVTTPSEELAVALSRPGMAAAVSGIKLDDGGFESSSQSQGVPTAFVELYWSGLEMGPRIDPGPPPTFRSDPEDCIVPTGGWCTGRRFVFSGAASHLQNALVGLPGSGNFGIAFTEDFLWTNDRAGNPDDEYPDEPAEINAFIVKAGSVSKRPFSFEPFTGTWELWLAAALLTSDGDLGSFGTIELAPSGGSFEQILKVFRDGSAPGELGTEAVSAASVTPFEGTTTNCVVAPYSFCTGWHVVSFDVTEKAGTAYGVRIVAHEVQQTVDVPVAFAFDDISLLATLAAQGSEGGAAIGLIAPHASYMIDDPTIQPLTFDWSLGASTTGCTLSDPTSATPSVIGCDDDGSVPLSLTLHYTKAAEGGGDGAAASEIVTGTLVLANVAPVVGPIMNAPLDPVPLNASLQLSALYADAGALDTHAALLLWNDDFATPCAAADGTAAGCSAPSTAGVYTVRMAVTDDDGARGSSDPYSYIVVYDPTIGHVTGGGWINSPAGAYVAQPSAEGKATFGFVAKYHKGATVPSGNTQFSFRAANLNFHSTAYEWLVVAGARAQFKGTGTINGSGDYGFMLTAVDGAVNGGGGTDRFRLKIWDSATGATVYDNEIGTSDGDTPATVLGGGSIVIHKG